MAARILVIEDNLASLDLMTYLLKAFGHTPFTAQREFDVGDVKKEPAYPKI
jgi:CheY-like chemotaxis protein